YLYHGRLSFFFFHAEDGIRDRNVTGVQTCALPISDELLAINQDSLGDLGKEQFTELTESIYPSACRRQYNRGVANSDVENYEARSEERRVGKEGRGGTRGDELDSM